ncbi:MAG: DUF4926 domain-containing protein [Deltaproteobacteria bacterium]|nr:DUF4926 domain-containing protein [Deltaproteobacteria bacterium]
MAIEEHERVVLKAPIPSEGHEAGDVGAVVQVYADGSAYEVEFTSLDGHTAAVVTVEADLARPVSRQDMSHARTMSHG